MADVKWIKINTDIFDNWKIKTLKAMPEGHTLVCIWVQLLCIAGARNEKGIIVFPNRMCTTDDILATVIGEDIKMVRLALELFVNLGMIVIDDDNSLIKIANWEEYQNVDGLEKMRKDNAKRQAKHREKLKIETQEKSNVTVTLPITLPSYSYSISNNNNINNINLSNNNNYITEYIKEIIDYLNTVTNSNYTYKNKSNNKHIKARLDEGHTVDEFRTVIDKMNRKWANDPKMAQYLRPETLFGNKFESYLNLKEETEKSESDKWLEMWEKA